MRSEVQKFKVGESDHLEYTIDLNDIKEAITDDTYDLTMKVWVDLNKVWLGRNGFMNYAELEVSHAIDAKTNEKKLPNNEIASIKFEMEMLWNRQEKINDRIKQINDRISKIREVFNEI